MSDAGLTHKLKRAVAEAGFHGRLALTRATLRRRYDAPREFTHGFWPEDLGLSQDRWADEDRNPYFPSPPRLLGRILRPAEVSSADVFIDIGCGAGRVVMEVARRYPFRRVLGVDVVPELVAVAQETVDRNRERLRCRDIELITEDVVEFRIPDDVTVTYLFDPFRGETFDALVRNLIASVDRKPRPVKFIYAVPVMADRLEQTGRARLVRHGRRMVRRWRPADYVSMYEILPAGPEPAR